MNSDLMPSPESSNSPASNQAENNIIKPALEHTNAPAAEIDNSQAEKSQAEKSQAEKSQAEKPQTEKSQTEKSQTENSQTENSQTSKTKTEETRDNDSRQQPIPPPSEPMQYRAIGLVRGRYQASSEQFTQGSLLTTDGTELNAVLLGRIMSLVKNHLSLDQEHLWVVYPRTRQENDQLHVQIVGVWEPENLAKKSPDTLEESEVSVLEESEKEQSSSDTEEKKATDNFIPSSEVADGGFSIRGEVVYQSYGDQSLVVKIKQAPRKPSDKPKYFKVKLQGKVDTKAVGKFWDFEVERQADILTIGKAELIADLPKKRNPFNNKFKKKRFDRGGKKPFRRQDGEKSRPVKRSDGSRPSSRPAADSRPPTPKPVKRQKPQEE